MVDDPNEGKKKRSGWHLRPFSETLKRKCRGQAAEKGQPEWKWVTEVLCKELSIAVESLAVLDSKLEAADENGKEPIRRSSPPDARKASAKNRRNTQA
jgi:hypothetical protein